MKLGDTHFNYYSKPTTKPPTPLRASSEQLVELSADNLTNCGGVDVSGFTNTAATWMAKSYFGSVSFFANTEVGKGREQDAEAFVKRNELAFRRKVDHQTTHKSN